MRTGLSQQTSMRQEMRVNPRLYQAMDMLYMPMMDLQQHLKQELLSNPFLELLEPEEEERAQEPTAEQQKEQKDKEDEVDWEEILLNGFEVGGQREQYEQLEYTEPVTVETADLADHLRDQLQMLDLSPRQQLLAEEFIGNINDDGYLSASLDEILDSINMLVAKHYDERTGNAGQADVDEEDEDVVDGFLEGPTSHVVGMPPAAPVAPSPAAWQHLPPELVYTPADAEAMLALVQRLDPPGIGARDLRECLLLQLREAQLTDSLIHRLVDEAFNDLLAHRWNELAKRFGVEPAKVQQAADGLARFDPKPGLKYANRGDAYVIPDLIVEKIDGQYRVFLNDTGVPRLRISRSYQEVARDKKKLTQENREFIAQKMNSANWMIQAIEQRRQTMLKVMNFIVDRQREFFEKGVEFLKPLTLREVAEVINMHESTVSRVTNEKFVQTPRGVLPLKFFFSSALATSSGEDASARSIRAKLEKMVAEEEPKKPLTDQQIVHLFQEQGIQIARRTVAKYRDQLGILPARMRKRV
jgi:RNA polymerase sigma-54 factor